MTRRRGVARRRATAALRVLADCFAPVCTLVGKTWALHLEKVVKVDRDENLRMIAESVALPARQRQARRSTTPSTSSTATATSRDYALRCIRAAAEAGAETVALLRHQRLVAAVAGRGGDGATRSRRSATASASGSTATTTPECGVANTLAAVEAGARQVQGTMNGCGERTGNANLVSIIANLQLKLGYRCLVRRAARAADRDRALRRRAAQRHARPQPAVRRAQRVRAQGRHARRRASPPTPTTFEHIDPALVGNERELLVSELAGRASMVEKAAELGIELDDDDRGARDRARQGARARGLPVRGRRRLARAAAAPRDAAATSRCSRSSPGA